MTSTRRARGCSPGSWTTSGPPGARLVMARVRTSVREMLRRTGIEDRIGPDRFCFTVVAAATAFEREEEEATPRSGDP